MRSQFFPNKDRIVPKLQKQKSHHAIIMLGYQRMAIGFPHATPRRRQRLYCTLIVGPPIMRNCLFMDIQRQELRNENKVVRLAGLTNKERRPSSAIGIPVTHLPYFPSTRHSGSSTWMRGGPTSREKSCRRGRPAG
jgi:hypothetical protein